MSVRLRVPKLRPRKRTRTRPIAYFLFIDESGHDRRASPYEVLAGITVRDTDLWRLIQDIHDLERRFFGGRYSHGPRELKGSNILKRKVFNHLALNCTVNDPDVPGLARRALDQGHGAPVEALKALAIAKTRYVEAVFQCCTRYNCRVFASVVETDAPSSTLDGLRKDYAYLFQRFYHYLLDEGGDHQGIIVFDELEKSKSHLLLDQAHRYFRDTMTGQAYAGLIVPEPFFVHSDLTTGIQIADLVAYCISWGFRIPDRMAKPARLELDAYVRRIAAMRHRSEISRGNGDSFFVWSIAHITDLRTSKERIDRGELE